MDPRIPLVIAMLGLLPLPGQAARTGPVVAGTKEKQVEFDFSGMKVLLQPPPPPYPPLAKIARIQGTVVVELTMDTEGKPLSAHAVEGPPPLRKTAEDYAMQFRFTPARLNGVPQIARFKLTLPFRLGNDPKVHVERAVLDVKVNPEEARGILQSLQEEFEKALEQLGVACVPAAGADPAKVHHIHVEVRRAPDGGTGYSLSLRCSLLKDLQTAANAPGQPWTVWQKVRGSGPVGIPLDAIRAQVMPLLKDVIAEPEAHPGVPPAP